MAVVIRNMNIHADSRTLDGCCTSSNRNVYISSMICHHLFCSLPTAPSSSFLLSRIKFKYCMSGKELDREQFAANSPWHKVREKLLNGKFFYIGTAGKPHLQDPPQVVVIKRRCRLGEITEERCETMLTEYYGNLGAAAAARQKQLTARGYNLKDSVKNAAQAKRDLEEEKAEMKRLGITPNTPRARAYLENTAERRGGAAFGGGSGEDGSPSTRKLNFFLLYSRASFVYIQCTQEV